MNRSALFALASILWVGAPQAHAATKAAAKPAAKAPATKAAPRYSARVTTKNPLFVGLAVDHSSSTSEPTAEGDTSIAEAVADAVNGNLEMMMALSSDGVHPQGHPSAGQPRFKSYFKIKGVGYNHTVTDLFGRGAPGDVLHADELAQRVQWVDAAGQPTTAHHGERMTWIVPKSAGRTAMGEALASLLPAVKTFVTDHPHAPAPVVMHFTDGEPTGEDPVPVAKKIMALGTKDGKALLFNVHIGTGGQPFAFPTAETIARMPPELREASQRLFDMSSPMPKHMIQKAREMFPEYEIGPGSRMMVYNASGALLTQLLELGTIQNMNVEPDSAE